MCAMQAAGPLPPPTERRHLHTREVSCQGYLRDDGLWDIEATMIDRKTYATTNVDARKLGAGDAVHAIQVRLTVDDELRVRAAVAALPATPFPECPAAAVPVQGLVGSTVGRGWRKSVDAAMGGVRGCTHVRELLAAMATVAFQTVPNYRLHQRRERGEPEPAASSPGRQVDQCLGWDVGGPLISRRYPQFIGWGRQAPAPDQET
jgi:hypothetical protein